MTAWEQLRREARRLENEVDAKLVVYAKAGFGATHHHHQQQQQSSQHAAYSPNVNGARGRSGEELADREREASSAAEHVEKELESLLSHLSSIVSSMKDHVKAIQTPESRSSHQSGPPLSAMNHALQRHEEILADYKLDFQKTRRHIASIRQHSELFAAHKSRAETGADPLTKEANSLYEERASLAASTNVADNSVAQGLTLRDELLRQRANFSAMMDRVQAMGSSVPAINTVINQIKRKKNRDVIIFAIVVSVLTFVTLVWKLF
ncbi:Golgi SNAP receptor complex member 1-2 [Porphyridium purpureum]|uniref:Golgi SNAP receptor complex member 1-2 n=1 Tax=Porphyridium purpureum TaxID=35688 RepID=A0A5J4YX39_PORPP|nr:Golgi SNAP receptor complex member 1-2 [Porphyridium purpureum]|eukprot:POR2788..scf209_3